MSGKEPKALLKSTIAIILTSLCLIAANWQYHRGVLRHAGNFKIEMNSKLPAIALEQISDYQSNEWRTVRATGNFESRHQVLLRNRYSNDGKYGYEFLTLFKVGDQKFWVDRGWVAAGNSAAERPVTPETPAGSVEIIGRLRLGTSLPRGNFFALPSSGDLISKWNLQSQVKTESFYIDLISANGVTPTNPAELPELSDGPHMAYALQWTFFGGLVLYGRFIIRKR